MFWQTVSRAGRKGPYFRSLHHLGSEAKDSESKKRKSVTEMTDQGTDIPMDQRANGPMDQLKTEQKPDFNQT